MPSRVITLLAFFAFSLAIPIRIPARAPIGSYPIKSDGVDINLTCEEKKEYYTTATILNRSVLYTINNTKTFEATNSPSPYQDYLILSSYTPNVTFHGKFILEYHIITSCQYTCTMEIDCDQNTTRFIAEHFDTYLKIGSNLHMMCNSAGCRWGLVHCKTFNHHDEL